MKLINKILFNIVIILLFFSCSSDDDMDISSNSKTKVELRLSYPQEIDISSPVNFIVSFKEINSGIETQVESKSPILNIDLISGNYKISVEGVIDNDKAPIKLTGILESISITGENQTIELSVHQSITQKGDLIFEEIYYTGSKNSLTGIPYFGDRYFKLYNNSDYVVYADGLLLAESEFTTNDKNDYFPNIMEQKFAAGGIIILPGKGKDYPIPPRSSIVIAESANNHNAIDKNYINLSSANFEMYSPYDDENVDNPQVPNTSELFNSVSIDKKGVRSYVIARLPENMSKETFLAENSYHYTYNEFGFLMDGDAMAIPNNWIIDAVNLSNGKDPDWILTSTSLDSGWTTCSLHEGDESRYGKSVNRIVTTQIPYKILQDTNNSKKDFKSGKPSLKK